MRQSHRHKHGFTLIELSIVLVIIGLIIGGVLMGQDMIKAAETRAQLTQIEKYNAAVNTFRTKYNGIPGDIDPTTAGSFGFTVGINCTGTQAGFRNGNGLIEGYISPDIFYQGFDEVELFWSDLSLAGFLDAPIPSGSGPPIYCATATPVSSVTIISEYLPVAKIGHGNFLYVYATGGTNWFGLSAVAGLGNAYAHFSTATISVTQAYNMDNKVDDGLPTTGVVQAVYIQNSVTSTSVAPNGNPDTASTCYNNATNAYSTNVSNGSGPNCALSFKMQGAAR
jgi:prepilin-type N-terminal cleavage/methylation domain-containing protein